MMDEELAAAIRSMAPNDGVFEGPVRETYCVRQDFPTVLENRRWRASLAIVASGTKELVLGGRTYALTRGSYTLTPLPLPVTSRFAEASASAPFLGLLVAVEPDRLRDIVADMDALEPAPEGPIRGLFFGRVDDAMLDAATRLGRLSASREAGAVLGASRVRELLYAVLRGPCGPAVRGFVQADGEAYRISGAVHRIEADLAHDLDITALACEVGMSRTVFFERFKRVTSTTPVQYQKRLRLLEAQRLMVEQHSTAEGAAYRVGYRSPSQFSREYARMFGEPPLTNAARLRRSEDARAESESGS